MAQPPDPTQEHVGEQLTRLAKRYEREQRARREAESIAERVTGELYSSMQELERLNSELTGTNDELRAVNLALRDFVAIASHDLRNPLTAILGFSSTLEHRWDALDDPRRREMLQAIQRQGEHLHRMIGDLLTVSKIEAGALDVHATVIELHEAVKEAIEDFSQDANIVRPLSLSRLTVIADPDHLHRILGNFMTNAFKYGEPPVSIETSDVGEWVEVRVIDHGTGIPVDFLPRLFSRFARADTEATRKERGTGLGLSIVQGLVQANGGSAWYEPVEPHGSCFVVRLPKAVA